MPWHLVKVLPVLEAQKRSFFRHFFLVTTRLALQGTLRPPSHSWSYSAWWLACLFSLRKAFGCGNPQIAWHTETFFFDLPPSRLFRHCQGPQDCYCWGGFGEPKTGPYAFEAHLRHIQQDLFVPDICTEAFSETLRGNASGLFVLLFAKFNAKGTHL